MTTATSSDQFEQRLDHLVAAAKKFRSAFYAKPFSIEIGDGSNPKVYITFVSNVWTSGYDKTISEICEEFNLTYGIVPLDKKLAITLS